MRGQFITVVLLSLFGAFSRSTDAGTNPTAEQPFMSRTEVRQQGAVTVRAAVLTDEESERYFGASLADNGIQVDVDNASDLRLRFLPIVTDPIFLGPRSRTDTSRLVARQYQCIDCIGGSASPDAGCDSARANRCRVRLHAP
jgi:hypothetical protein